MREVDVMTHHWLDERTCAFHNSFQVDLCLCHKEYNHCVQNNDDRVIPEIDPNEDLHTLNITSKVFFIKIPGNHALETI